MSQSNKLWRRNLKIQMAMENLHPRQNEMCPNRANTNMKITQIVKIAKIVKFAKVWKSVKSMKFVTNVAI